GGGRPTEPPCARRRRASPTRRGPTAPAVPKVSHAAHSGRRRLLLRRLRVERGAATTAHERPSLVHPLPSVPQQDALNVAVVVQVVGDTLAERLVPASVRLLA